MEFTFSVLRQTRANIIKSIDGLDNEALNTIPDGFNNNISWNVAHLAVTLRLLCYKLSGQEVGLDEAVVEAFRKGSCPDPNISVDVAPYTEMLLGQVDTLEADYKAGLFMGFNPYPTSFGTELSSIDDAIQFNLVHEALHFGYILALKRAL